MQGGRIYILPTRYGMAYTLLVGGMLVGSVNYNNNLGFGLSFLLVGLGLVGMLHTWRNLRGLEIRAGRASAVFAGGEAHFPVDLRNRSRRPRPGLELATEHGAAPAVDLGAGGDETLLLAVPATRRGRVSPGRLRAQTRFPLGLFRAWTYVSPDVSSLVYPRPASRSSPPQQPRYGEDEQGDKGSGADDFVGLRGYHPGDSLRHVDWKALARERGLLSRQFGGDRADELWIDWDAWAELETEARLSRLCRCLLDAARQQADYGLRLPGREIRPARGPAHEHRCLAALARFEAPA